MTTHAQLVELAAKWLQKKCPLVITEMSSTGREIPDAIGWRVGFSILIECKVSIEDFKRDADKFFRKCPEEGMGVFRYYMAPKNLLKEEWIPEKWGFLEVGTKIFETRKPERFDSCHRGTEIDVLISAVRRIGATAPKGISVKCYTYETLCTATLGIEKEALNLNS